MIEFALLAALVLAVPAEKPGSNAILAAGADTTLTLGDRPAVVAFFSVPSEVFAEQPALPQVLADFHNFLADARGQLRGLMVDVHEAYGQPIRLRSREKEWVLPVAAGLPVGYYLWSPRGPTYVCRGVRASPTLVDLVREYVDGDGEPGAALSRCERVGP